MTPNLRIGNIKIRITSYNVCYTKLLRNNYAHEARFLRAYFYFNLVRQYGGVPLVTHVPTTQEVNKLTRASSEDIFKFIESECDDITNKIIADYTALGSLALSTPETARANRLTVLALKARAALYAASPLFNTTDSKSYNFV